MTTYSSKHHYQQLIEIFNDCFEQTYNTRLVKGDDEPIYLPADNNRLFNEIVFAHGFFSSALHECAHWFIAGAERRQLVDFGYWYEPDGRTAEQQNLFEKVEVKPQAIEWILSVACNHKFKISVDNLNGEKTDATSFKQAVYQQVCDYIKLGLPQRAEIFRLALAKYYHTSPVLLINKFDVNII